jgi:hypothetical protein
MSNQIIIPNNNLPVCIQEYEWKFLNDSGNVTWATSCAIPSNVELNRVWNFNLSGNIIKTSNIHILVGDFNKVKTYGYTITFEGPLQGTITINGQVLDANKFIDYKYDSDKKIMTLVEYAKSQKISHSNLINKATRQTIEAFLEKGEWKIGVDISE